VRRFALLVAICLPAGCESSAVRRTDIPRTDWSRESVPVAPKENSFDAAKYAVSQWFTVELAQPQDGLITTYPVEYTERGGTGRFRDASPLKYPNRMRRKAIVRVSQSGDQASIDCVVITERLDTSDYRVFAMNREFDDVNNQTPIDEDAATSARQNDVWTEVGRDRGMERQILNVARDRLRGETSPVPPPADAQAPAEAPPPAADAPQ